MIIVEGPDGAGKTTLVQHLSQKYGAPIAKKVVDHDTKPIYTDLQGWTERNLSKGLQWKIFDRHRLVSEPIYAGAMERPPAPGFDDIHWLTARMIDFTRIRPFLIYCLPPYETVAVNVKHDHLNHVVAEFISPIYYLYAAHAAGDIARGQAVLFDYTIDSGYQRVDMLFRLWQKNHRRQLERLKGYPVT